MLLGMHGPDIAEQIMPVEGIEELASAPAAAHSSAEAEDVLAEAVAVLEELHARMLRAEVKLAHHALRRVLRRRRRVASRRMHVRRRIRASSRAVRDDRAPIRTAVSAAVASTMLRATRAAMGSFPSASPPTSRPAPPGGARTGSSVHRRHGAD